MTDDLKTMPERIWCRPIWSNNFSFTTVEAVVSYQDVEYIRADLAAEKPADDEVRMEDIVQEITYHLNKARCLEKRVVGNHELASRIFETLAMKGYIRAATTPRQDDIAEKLAGALEKIRFEAGTDAQIRPPAHVLENVLKHLHDFADEALAEFEAQKSSGKGEVK